MFTSDNNPFDPANLTKMFGNFDPTKMFDASQFTGFDSGALMAAQQKNVDALVQAQQAAAAGYQDLFDKQTAIFQETLKAAQAQIAELSKSDGATDIAQKQAELTQKAYETAVANVTELSEMANKANSDAFEIVKARIEASVKEMMKS